ncbi:hypothetical protein ACFC51_32485 [Streptomyces sp. NPDC055962]|uniref:hypothetical protein n=1 Tax=Streptomyces sp. NPDC055962 TaxID=3345667 RepID=UPI0035E0FF95
MKTSPVSPDRTLRLAVVITCLVILFVCLVVQAARAFDDDQAAPRGVCPAVSVTPLNPATCQLYSPGTVPAPVTNDSRSSAQKPRQQAPAAKAPAPPVKAPAPPVKAPAPPVKAPAAPPRPAR